MGSDEKGYLFSCPGERYSGVRGEQGSCDPRVNGCTINKTKFVNMATMASPDPLRGWFVIGLAALIGGAILFGAVPLWLAILISLLVVLGAGAGVYWSVQQNGIRPGNRSRRGHVTRIQWQ
jgi:hypothetical protein